MPRTFKATIALIVTLIGLVLLTILNVWQTNNTEEKVIDLSQRVESLKQNQSKILDKIEKGVKVSGNTSQNGSSSGNNGAGEYEAALNDPENLLDPRTEPVIPQEAKEGGALQRRLSSQPKGYNWITENGADVSELQKYVHSSFAERDLENPDKWVPDLAYKITVNDDYTEYTIHIREGVYWQKPPVDMTKDKYDWLEKPRELTAEDCVFTFDLIKNDQVQAGHLKNYFKDMKEAKVVDRYTFKVIWKKKTYQSLSATIGMYPMPKWLYSRTESGKKIPEASLGLKFNSHWASRNPIGVGPYEVESISDTKITLNRFDDYFGKKPPIKKIDWHIIKRHQTGYNKLVNGELDVTALNPPLYKSKILEGGKDSPFKNGELKHKVIDAFAYYYIGWNGDKPLFSSPKVRKAMTHALNREGILENVVHGLGTIQTGHFYYKHPANNPNVEPYEYDLDKARNLLEQAGWKDNDGDGVREKKIDGSTKEFDFTILAYANQPKWKSTLTVYKQALRKIGVKMAPSYVDWPTMQKKMDEKKFDAYTGGWALGWNIDPYQIWHSSQADVPKGSNRVGFRNDRADEIIEGLRSTFDEDKRLELAREFHKILHEKQPYTFFYAPKTPYAWQPRLKNMEFQKIRPQSLSFPWYISPSGQ